MRTETKMTMWTVAMTMVLAVTMSSRAATVTFEFDSAGATGAALSGLSTGTHAVDGVTIDATAQPSGVFNQTGTGFGINAAPSGDDTDAFDAGSVDGAESMDFFFDTVGILVSMKFDRFTEADGDTFDLIFDGGSTLSFVDGDLGGSNLASINTAFALGQKITLLYTGTADSGFGLENIVIETTAIPSPAALPAGLALIGLLAARRRR